MERFDMPSASRRFWFSSILLVLSFVLILMRFFFFQIADPSPYRLNGCEIEMATGREAGK
jgi:hypothetical protein